MKILSTITLFLMVMGLNAQISSGTLRLGPDISISSAKSETQGSEITNFSLDLALRGGYFIATNFEVGLEASYNTQRTEDNSAEVSTNSFGIGPQLTYYVPASSEVYIFFTGAGLYNSFTTEVGSGDATFTGFRFDLGTGLEYLISQRLSARFGFGYNFGTLEDSDTDVAIDINDINVGLGVGFYF